MRFLVIVNPSADTFNDLRVWSLFFVDMYVFGHVADVCPDEVSTDPVVILSIWCQLTATDINGLSQIFLIALDGLTKEILDQMITYSYFDFSHK